MVGAFGLAEVLTVMKNPPAEMAENPQDSVHSQAGGYHRSTGGRSSGAASSAR
ncbi:MAG: hypothetical protein MZV64_70810 [Ignavibacteriales bacterium]|nr:hypothetical protein [Ignavibacteriales bacterium]